MKQKYLTEHDLYKRWDEKVALPTLRNWRAAKINKGPAFVKFGQKVLYPESAVKQYEDAALLLSNAEVASA